MNRTAFFAPLRQPMGSIYWWALLAVALAGCVLTVLSHIHAKQELADAEVLLGRVREARVDLANGFLHVALAGDPDTPFRRETGLALIEQALADLQTAAQLTEPPPAVAARTDGFPQRVARFRAELTGWNAAAEPKRAEQMVHLRVTLHELERMAEQIDRRALEQMQDLSIALERRFIAQIGVAVLLLASIAVAAVVSIRHQRATIVALRESEERLRVVSDSLPDSYVYQYNRAADGSTRFAYVSAGVERIHGVTPADVMSGKVSLLAGLDLRERAVLRASEAASARDLADFEMEFWVAASEGRRRLLHVRSRPRQLADGSVQWSGMATDLTVQRQAQEELEAQASLLRTMSSLAHVGGWEFDPRTGQGTWTDEVARIHDMDPALATNRDIGLSVYQGESRQRIEAALKAVIEEGRSYDLELQMQTASGTRKWVRTQGEAVWREGRVVQVRGAIRDITAQRRMEVALRESEARFRQLFEQAGDGIILISADGRYEDINTLGLAMVGYMRDELIGQPVGLLTAESERSQLAALEQELARGTTSIKDWPLRRKDGRVLRVEVSVRRLSDGRTLNIFRDQTERQRGEERAALQWLVTRELALGAAVEPTVRRIIKHCCARLSWEAGAYWRLEPKEGKLKLAAAWHEAVAPYPAWLESSRRRAFGLGEGFPGAVAKSGQAQWVQDAATLARDPRAPDGAWMGIHDGAGVPVLVRGQVAGVLELYRRTGETHREAELSLLTAIGTQFGQYLERQELEEQIRQSQKLEALGTMAGGIAHDFNNILTAIVLNASLAQIAAKGDAELEEHLQEVILAGKRATDLVKQILAFSRRQEQKLRSVQLARMIAECAKLLRATLPATIELKTDAPANLPPVQADPIQVHQVLTNLGTNAAHAMRERPGALEISAQAVAIDRAAAGGPRTGRYVRVTVRDTGHGMDAATKARIFEPFFTTKAPGEGTGLGLAVVHGIMHQHGGAITVESQPGVGTTFELYFPVAEGEGSAEPFAQPAPVRGKGQRILVVDDEPGIALATCQVLNESGYRAESREGAETALAAVQAEPEKFGLVLTDYTMPRMTGLELTVALRRIKPGLPVLLMTGGATDLLRPKIDAIGGADLLAKPVTPGQLLTAVGAMLNRPAGNGEGAQLS